MKEECLESNGECTSIDVVNPVMTLGGGSCVSGVTLGS